MKKTLLTLAALILIFTAPVAQAQLINPGFETWTNDILVSGAEHPNTGNDTYGWWDYNTFNHTLLGSSPISIIKCTDTVRTGNYAVRLETQAYTQASWDIYKLWGIPFIGHEYNDTLGILFNGKVDVFTQSYKPGIPFTQKLSQFIFYYQYNPNGNDTAECRVSLMNNGTLVAGGAFKTGVATGSLGWQQGVVNFTYVNGLTPDTMYVLISSSSLDYDPSVGSVLWIDDISVITTGVEELSGATSDVVIFPNPSNGIFSIQHQNNNNEPQSIDIYNVVGEKVYSTISNTETHDIDISLFPKGVYFVKLDDGEKVIAKKIVVK